VPCLDARSFNNVKIEKIENNRNRLLVKQYYKFMDSTDSSGRHQNNNLKLILSYVDFIGNDISLSSIDKIDSIIFFLKTKKRSKDNDPDQKWIST
jgi:hypothetical protein